MVQSGREQYRKALNDSCISSIRSQELDIVSQSSGNRARQFPFPTRLSQIALSKFGKLTKPLFPQRPNGWLHKAL